MREAIPLLALGLAAPAAVSLSRKVLRRVFGSMLLLVSLKMIFSK
jgi:uncharacterized membrane protein YfcA